MIDDFIFDPCVVVLETICTAFLMTFVLLLSCLFTVCKSLCERCYINNMYLLTNRKWDAHHFTNATLLELCRQTPGLREYVCHNVSLRRQQSIPASHLYVFCAYLEAEQESRKCFLQRFFDMLPAPYDFDTSRLCAEPGPLLMDAVERLSACEVEDGGWPAALGYLLRVLDFMVGLSSGLEEGEGEARLGD